MVQEQLVIHIFKSKSQSLFCTIDKNKIKMDHRPEIIKLLEENTGENLYNLGLDKNFLSKI